MRWLVVLLFLGLSNRADTLLVDLGFPTGAGPDKWARSLSVDPHGRILVTGNFTKFNDVASAPIVRLSPDGALDSSFAPGQFDWEYTTGSLTFVSALPDGRVLIQGSFTNVAGFSRPSIAVLGPDGKPDPGFVPAALLPGTARYSSIRSAPDGGFWASGSFTNIGGLSSPRVARLHASSSPALGTLLTLEVELSFAPGERGKAVVVPLPPHAPLTEDQIIGIQLEAVTSELQLDSPTVANLVVRATRTLPAGAVDTNFVARSDAPVIAAVALREGGWLLAVSPTNANGYSSGSSELRLLRSDGTAVEGFVGTNRLDGSVKVIRELPDGSFLVGGSFTVVNSSSCPALARFGRAGTFDSGFAPFSGVIDPRFSLPPTTADLLVMSDGSVLCSGSFILHNDSYLRRRLVRIQPDGKLDLGFAPGAEEGSSEGTALLPIDDGSYLLGLLGDSVSVGRFLRDGSRDSQFIPPAHTPVLAEALALRPDSTFVAVGVGSGYGDPLAPTLGCFARNGSEILPFRANTARWLDLQKSSFTAVRAQGDGRVLVAGSFVIRQGQAKTTLLRLHADGTWDPSLDPGSGAAARPLSPQAPPELQASQITVLEPMPDGDLLVGGDFASFDGFDQPFLVRLLPEGTQRARTVHVLNPEQTIFETAGDVEFDVIRAGDASEPATVRVQTRPLTAAAETDYTPLNETVTFGPGEWLRTAAGSCEAALILAGSG